MARMTGIVAFIIIVLVIALFIAVGWLIYTHLRARRLGLPQPTLSSYNPFAGRSQGYGSSQSGFVGKVKGMFAKKNNRSAGGAYEEPLSSNVRGRANNRGFGPLDPDEAWDARVGTEADAYGPGGYYEEQELGLHGGPGLAAGAASTSYGGERGRSLSREPEPYIGGSQAGLDRRYDEEMGKGKRPAQNPFADDAELSNIDMRGVSPRPMDGPRGHRAQESLDDTSERRSIFKENM